MKRFIHFITYSKAAPYIAALLCVVSWCIRVEAKTLTGFLWLLCSLLVGYLLIKVNREFSLSDSKSLLPTTFYFMGCCMAPDLLAQHGAGVHIILFSLAGYVLLQTYRERYAMGRYFLAFTLIGIQCLLAPPLLLTFPWLVLCGTFMESLSARSFFAALWGLLFPFWVAFGVLFLTDRMEVVAPYFEQVVSAVSTTLPPQPMSHWWNLLLWPLLIVLPGSIGILLNRTMKLQASAGFRLLIGALVVLFVTMWLSSVHYAVLLPCVWLIAALIGSAMFTFSDSRAKNIYLIVLLLIWFSFWGLSLWNNF